MHVFVLSNLYPNSVQVRHGVFVRERIKHFLSESTLANLEVTIVAPIPTFPFRQSYRSLKAVPRKVVDRELGVTVYHPRYMAVPLLGNLVSPLIYAFIAWRLLRHQISMGSSVVFDAHFGFPDNAAATLMGRLLKVPVVTTYRGSDLNTMALEAGVRSWTRWSLRRADAVIAVSQALKNKAQLLADTINPVSVVRNGVNQQKFSVADNRCELRRQLGFEARTLISVGNLHAFKGHQLVIEAIAKLPSWNLIIIGSGPEEMNLQAQIDELKLEDRVSILGELKQEALVKYYQAADGLVLASSREGLPNVVLEALSCGTPVVAADVGGVGEALTTACQGELLANTTAVAIAKSIDCSVLPKNHDQRSEIRRSIAHFDWSETVKQLDEIFSRVVSNHLSHAKSDKA